MRGRSYSYSPSPPREYGRRRRSPSPRARHGSRGTSLLVRNRGTSLLVRNLRHDFWFAIFAMTAVCEVDVDDDDVICGQCASWYIWCKAISPCKGAFLVGAKLMLDFCGGNSCIPVASTAMATSCEAAMGTESWLILHLLWLALRPEDLCQPFGQFGPLKDIYLPRDYHTGEPRGFGFVQYIDPGDAADAKYHMDGQLLLGRELTVVFAEENRKKPSEMRARERYRGRDYDRRSSPLRYSRSPCYARRYSRSPYYRSPSPRRRHYSRSISPRGRRYRDERSYSRSPYYSRSRSQSISQSRSRSLDYSR